MKSCSETPLAKDLFFIQRKPKKLLPSRKRKDSLNQELGLDIIKTPPPQKLYRNEKTV